MGRLTSKNTDKSSKYDTVTIEKLNSNKRKNKRANQVIFIIYMFILLFIGLFAYLIHFQFSEAPKLVKDYRNPKLIEKEKNIKLGSIYASDEKTVLAVSEKTDSGYMRKYPQGEAFAHPIGYSKNGRTGLESSLYKSLLSTGNEDLSIFDKIKVINEKKEENVGNSVITTLDSEMQNFCYNAMGSRKGAIVLMEPSTGKVLTMVSKPSFDPNNLEENWENLVTDEKNSPLINRATQGLYPPGSTFKVLTALEYMRENPNYRDYRYNCQGIIQRDGLSVACAFNTAHGTLDIYGALAQSCNGAFIDMGMTLNVQKYRELVESFGFNGKLPIDDIQYAESVFKLTPDSSNGEKMQTVFGQGNTLVSPMQNCLIASTIANDGVMMKTQFVNQIIDANNVILKSFEPSIYKKILSQEENNIIKEMMQGVVTNGIANSLNNRQYSVACKTGTAQYNNNENTHNLIIGFAPVENPKVAFSIVLEGYEGQPERDYDLMNITSSVLNKFFNR